MATIRINNRDIPVLASGADWSARQIFGHELAGRSYPTNLHDWFSTGIRSCPIEFTLRYADFAGQGHAVLTPQEHQSHEQAGIRSYLIFQKTTRDPDGGFARGVAYGHEAIAEARRIGIAKGKPIFFTADAPIGSYNIDVAMQFFRGAQQTVNAAGWLCGVYGFGDIIHAAQDRGVGNAYWLAGALSLWRPGIHLYQWNNGRIYPGQPPTEADLCLQFERLPGESGTRRVSDVILGRLEGDARVWAIGAEGRRWIETGKEAEAHKRAGASEEVFTPKEWATIPPVGQAVMNYGIPPTLTGVGLPPLRTDGEFESVHRVLASISEKGGASITLTPEQFTELKDALVAAAVAGLTDIVPTSEQNAQATVAELKKEGN